MSSFDQIIFIWHQPQLPENLGAVARAMANFSFASLRLISPLCSLDDPKALATSAGADSILQSAEVYSCFEEAVKDINWLYGTCATVRQITKSNGPISQVAPGVIEKIKTSKIGILFGPERTGLDNELLARCHQIIQIPVNPDFSSLNISQACVVIAYELYKTLLESQNQIPEENFYIAGSVPAPQQQLNQFLLDLETRLDRINYWRVPSKKDLMWRNLQNILTRMQLTQQDIQTLWGVLDRFDSK